uniref:Helitron helicase-like domain-containing protein n=1 Tax=Tanacetum cinerariifolium TaxID=118510 RepID=A0A6L2K924_TANCI|nr:helitron helicase-like domain-containing protein [Tanacetum cinerariifolium]
MLTYRLSLSGNGDDVDQFGDSFKRKNTVAPQQGADTGGGNILHQKKSAQRADRQLVSHTRAHVSETASLHTQSDMLGHTPSSSLVALLNHEYLCMDVTEHTIRPQIISFSDGSLKDGSKIAANQRSTFSSRTAGDSRARLVANSEESLANPGVTTPPAKDVSYIDLVNCDQKCHYCGCLFWYVERRKGAKYDGQPEYHLCCGLGKIYMPQASVPALFIRQLLTNIHFMEHIQAYNQMSAMTLFGAKVDDSINKGRGPYVFKVSGQIYHWIGSLCPEEGHDPWFLQLYIYDTQDEVANRMQNFRGRHQHTLNPQIVEGLVRVLDKNNALVRLFRTARDRCSA